MGEEKEQQNFCNYCQALMYEPVLMSSLMCSITYVFYNVRVLQSCTKFVQNYDFILWKASWFLLK